MQTTFSYDLATGRYARGSGEPLGTHVAPEDADTQDSDTVVLDGPEKQPDDPPSPPGGNGKRKMYALGDDEIQAFTSMTM
jgi:hypothetical protein